jgi:hypothetical protein
MLFTVVEQDRGGIDRSPSGNERYSLTSVA